MTDLARDSSETSAVLSGVDFSAHSQVREPLRRHLLELHGSRLGTLRPRSALSQMHRYVRSGWVAVSVAGVVSLFVCAWLGMLTPAAQGFEAVVRSLALGEHSVVQQLSPPAVAFTPTSLPTPIGSLAAEMRGSYWIIQTPAGSFTCPAVLPGRDATLRRFDALDQVPADLPFGLVLPRHLPQGQVFREGLVTPLHGVFLFYSGPDGDMVLIQMPVGRQPGDSSSSTIFAAVEMLTDGPIEQVSVGGRTAAWVGKRALMWENSGINYILGGVGLSKDETVRIAESLE
jgi:hypothetical protein